MKTKTHNSFHRVVVAVALIAGFGAAAQATEFARVRVNYSDLNVNTEAGAAVLYQRIRNAADEVCGTFGVRDLGAEAAAKACKARAIGEAVASVKAPALSQVHEAKLGVKVTRFASL
jgi:UrcA family protein